MEIEELLTDDDKKIIKHLSSIDRLFKKGNVNLCELFANNGHLCVTIMYNGIEYEIESFDHITCDGGDCSPFGTDGIHWNSELRSLLNDEMEEL